MRHQIESEVHRRGWAPHIACSAANHIQQQSTEHPHSQQEQADATRLGVASQCHEKGAGRALVFVCLVDVLARVGVAGDVAADAKRKRTAQTRPRMHMHAYEQMHAHACI
eukprot:4559133-Pleurochrysis_carterae.AAC.1